jgi:ADP-ribose pyrophosphatase
MDLKVIKNSIIHTGRVFTTVVDDVVYPSGRVTVREVAKHPGGSLALAVFPDNRIIMIRQHRYPIDRFIWELPAGKLEPGEPPIDCARRELEEETGYRASEWKKMTSIWTSPGFCDEELHIFLATGLTPAPNGRQLEEGEQTMTVEIVAYAQALAMIRSGEINDAKTICGILLGKDLLNITE